MLSPLARLAVGRGLRYTEMVEVLKQCFVAAAREAHPSVAPHRAVSRISAATGLNRREVTRQMQRADGEAAVRPSPSTQAFTRWLTEPALQAPGGGPLPLPVLGRAPSKFSASMRERIGYMPQQFVLYPNLTVWENLNFVASLYGMGYFRRRKRLLAVLEFAELGKARSRLGSQLSGGERRRLELACSLVHNPLLLFADEPTAGIDPVLRGKFWDHFRELRRQGHTLFVTTQYVGEAAYCDLVGVMRNGRWLLGISSHPMARNDELVVNKIRSLVAPGAVSNGASVSVEVPLR